MRDGKEGLDRDCLLLIDNYQFAIINLNKLIVDYYYQFRIDNNQS